MTMIRITLVKLQIYYTSTEDSPKKSRKKRNKNKPNTNTEVIDSEPETPNLNNTK